MKILLLILALFLFIGGLLLSFSDNEITSLKGTVFITMGWVVSVYQGMKS